MEVRSKGKKLKLPAIGLPILFWFLSSYPAKMTSDSLDVWGQVQSGNFNNWHTVSYGYFVYVFSFGGRILSVVTLVQACLAYYALYKLISILLREQSKDFNIKVTSLLYFLPFIGSTAVTLWKDVPYSAFTIIGLSHLIEWQANNRTKTRNLLVGLISLGLSCLFRHDGGPTILLISILMISSQILQKRKKSELKLIKESIFLAIVGIFAAILSLTLVSISNSAPTPKWLQTSSFLADLQYVNYFNHTLLDHSTRKILNEISKDESLIGAGDCNSFNSMVFSNGFDTEAANFYASEIPKLWIRALGTGASNMILQARFCRGKAFVPFPFTNSPGYAYWLAGDIDQPNQFGLERISIIPGLHMIQTFWSYTWQSNQLFLAWPGLHTSIALFISLFLIKTKKISAPIQLLSLYLISRTFVLVTFTTAQDFRYMYAGYFISLALIATLAVKLLYGNQKN